MAFPLTPLPVSVQIAPGVDPAGSPSDWAWTDITAKVRVASGIDIAVGKADEAQVVDPGTCSLTVNNAGGVFSIRNPLGPWFGKLAKNTPLRVRLPYESPNMLDTFNRTVSSDWGIADTGQVWQYTGAGGTVAGADFNVTPAGATHKVPAGPAFRLTFLPVENTDVEVALTAWIGVMPTGGNLEPGNICIRQQLDFSSYLYRVEITPAGVVSAKIFGAGGAQIAQATVAGITYAPNLKLRVRARALADQLAMKVWKLTDPEPVAWTVTVTDSSITAPGEVAVRSGVGPGVTNPLPVTFTYDDVQVTEYVDRFAGTVPEWPPRWDKSGKDVTVRITAAGALRRLQQGSSPLRPPMRRAMERLQVADRPLAYYPLEEGSDATKAYSGLPGGAPATLINTPGFGEGDGLEGSPNIFRCHVGSGCRVPIYNSSTSSWSFDWQSRFGIGQSTGYGVYSIRLNTLGRYNLWEVTTYADSWGIWPQDTINMTSPGVLQSNPKRTLYDGQLHHLRIICMQSTPTQVDVFGYCDGVLDFGVGLTSTTLGPIMNMEAPAPTGDVTFTGPQSTKVDLPDIGHVAFWNGYPQVSVGYVDLIAATHGYVGETASSRISRLCAEEGVPVLIDSGPTETLGPQRAATFVDLLREAAEADGGVLSEYGAGLRYTPRVTRYNAPVMLALDFAAGHIAEPPEPVDDDQGVTNDVTVRRPNGISAQYVDTTSSHRVSLVGRYDTDVELNLPVDDNLYQHAAWRVHKGTVDELRWPVLALDLASRPATQSGLRDKWLGTPLGSRITAANPPSEVGPGTIDVVLEGYREHLEPFAWKVTANCSQASTWKVFVLDSDRLDADSSSKLVADITATATTLQVSTSGAAGAAWTTSSAEWTSPKTLHINIGGEQMRVTNIVGASSPQTFTVVRAINGVIKPQKAGSRVGLWQPRVLAL